MVVTGWRLEWYWVIHLECNDISRTTVFKNTSLWLRWADISNPKVHDCFYHVFIFSALSHASVVTQCTKPYMNLIGRNTFYYDLSCMNMILWVAWNGKFSRLTNLSNALFSSSVIIHSCIQRYFAFLLFSFLPFLHLYSFPCHTHCEFSFAFFYFISHLSHHHSGFFNII